ncbi:MAG: phosphatase PAP2 family protein [Chitinophagales bacterium]|nr:phosphatase PAP2 family protein [Chitinophagales bacterium]
MKEIIQRSAGFYYSFFLLVFVGALYLSFLYEHGAWVLWFCENFNPSIYLVFEYITVLGEPQIVVPFIAIIFLLNYGRGALLFLSWSLASLLTIVLKGLIANHRPAYYFEDIFTSCAGEIKLWFHLSTPSGHTTAAFAFFAAMALLSRNKALQFLFLLAALCIGLSRMVLFMHFFYDVYFGAIIGSLVPIVLYWLLEKRNYFKYNSWKDRSWIKL